MCDAIEDLLCIGKVCQGTWELVMCWGWNTRLELQSVFSSISSADLVFSNNTSLIFSLWPWPLGIRYPEELSFLKPVDKSKEKDKKSLGPITPDGQSFKRSSRASSSSNGSLNKGSTPASPYNTPQRTPVHIQPLSVSYYCLYLILPLSKGTFNKRRLGHFWIKTWYLI